MILPWASFEEYSDSVTPLFVTKSLFRSLASRSLLDRLTGLKENAKELLEAINDLRELGYNGECGAPASGQEPGPAPKIARGVCIHIGHVGEEMLIHMKGLATTYEVDDFLHEKDITEHWDRYVRSDRIHNEINELISAAETLHHAYYNVVKNSGDFLVDQFDFGFPTDLKRDFLTARDQFSVGLEEAGFLSAGRGLEGVLRAVARKKQLLIESKGMTRPAAEESFFDLIECLARARWRTDKSSIITGRVRTLLHHIRTSRNAVAHPGPSADEDNWRELAVIVASQAGKIWKLAERRYAGLVNKKIARDWQR